MVERIEGFCSEADWKRAYQEINEMEEHMANFGAVIVKFWIHIDKDEQERRFKERMEDPAKQWKITDEDWRNREKWDAYGQGNSQRDAGVDLYYLCPVDDHRRNISLDCGRSPRRCEMHPVRLLTRWAALGWVIRAITTTRQRARSACARRRWPCRGRSGIAARKNLSFFQKGLDILAYCRYNYPCCLSRRYSSVGRAADL